MIKCIKYFLALLLVLCGSCSSSGSSSEGGYTGENQNASGVWSNVPLGKEAGKIFVAGIITPEYNARFIGDAIQYVGTVDVRARTVLNGELSACVWTTTGGVHYQTNHATLDMFGYLVQKFLLMGSFRYDANPDENVPFEFIYNTTYEVPPSIDDIKDSWVFVDEWKSGNTLVLTITPSTEVPTIGNITGSDTLGNSFLGTISIHYSPPSDTPKNIYDLSLQFYNTSNGDTVSLGGLATYLESYNEDGSAEGKTLCIGATSADYSYSLNGFGTQ